MLANVPVYHLIHWLAVIRFNNHPSIFAKSYNREVSAFASSWFAS